MFKKIALTLIVSVVGINVASCSKTVVVKPQLKVSPKQEPKVLVKPQEKVSPKQEEKVLTKQEEKTVATIEKNIEKVQLSKEEQASVKKFIKNHKAAVLSIVGLVGLAATGTSLYCLQNYVQKIPVLAGASNEVVYIVNGAWTMVKNYGGSAVYGFGVNQVAEVKAHWLRTSIAAAVTLSVIGFGVWYYTTKISKKANKKQDTTPVVIAVPKPA
jgi:hypothetical protein